jgi:hypothetical protein
MTRQEAFDQAFYGITAQKGPSMSPKGFCLYRDPNGNKCAIGHLIPDYLYSPAMDAEATGVNEIMTFYSAIGTLLHGLGATFLNDLQTAHDAAVSYGGDFMTNFLENMQEVAQDHKLRSHK